MPIVLFIIGVILGTLLVQFGWNIGLVQAGVAKESVDFWTALALLVCLTFLKSIFARTPAIINLSKEQA